RVRRDDLLSFQVDGTGRRLRACTAAGYRAGQIRRPFSTSIPTAILASTIAPAGMRCLIKSAPSNHIGSAGENFFRTACVAHRLRAISRQESVMFSWPRPATGASTRERRTYSAASGAPCNRSCAVAQFVGTERYQDAKRLAQRLARTLKDPIDGHRIDIGASIGIAMAPVDGVDADQLLKKADMALYAAQNGGGGDHRFFALGWRKQPRKGARSNSTCAKPWFRISSNSTSSHWSICARAA